ncbi:MAG: ATP-dependent RNA helicase DbpA [Candidatus Omnitrophica bacterium]|nr:ATP-dependent RNA helicase DbpA [Candidatus Omnitrophota bacterium]
MPPPTTNFKKVKLSPEILENLDSLGYLQMTPIQRQGLPSILANRDFIGQASTGSGKTAVFALGILAKLDPEKRDPQAVVVVPTRELASQVANEIRRLARFSPNVKVLTLCGGSQERHAVKSLQQGAHIIVGTPGRLIKFLEKGTLNPTGLTTLVLDEADRLLEMGFNEEVHTIAAFIRGPHQTMLFSATLPNGIKALSESLLNDPMQVTVDSQHQKNAIDQIFYKSGEDKNVLLLRVLANYQPESCLIFCNSQDDCQKVSAWLRRHKMQALPMHSGLEQKDRTLTLIKFGNRSTRILVATDLASRGIDVKDVGMVINYDLPQDHEMYVHRIGRTGRAGQKGLAVSFYTPAERPVFMAIGEYLKEKCTVHDVETLRRFRPVSLQAPMATIYISGGKKNNIRPGDILGALTKDAGLEGTDVGQIQVLEVNSYVAIAAGKREHAIKHFLTGKIKGKKFKVGKA